MRERLLRLGHVMGVVRPEGPQERLPALGRSERSSCAKEGEGKARLPHQGRSSDLSAMWARLQSSVESESQLRGTKKLQSLCMHSLVPATG